MAPTSWKAAGYSALARAADIYAARFQRLSQGFKRSPGELWDFVEEQYAAVRERDLARPSIAAAAGQGCYRRRVVWGAEWPAHAIPDPGFSSE